MLNVLLFFALYFICIVLTIIALPVFSFVLYQLVYFFNPNERWWGENIYDLRYSLISVFFMIAIYLFNQKKYNQNKLFDIKQFKYLYLFFLVFCFVYFNAISPEIHLDALIDLMKLIIIISVAYKLIDSRRSLEIVLKAYISGCWYIGYIIYDAGRNSGLRVEGLGTIESPDSNGIAAAIAPALVLSLYFFWRNKNKYEQIIMFICGIFIANALILINSRGSFIAIIVCLLFYVYNLFFSAAQKKSQKFNAIILVILGLSGSGMLADQYFFERIETIITTEKSDTKQTAYTRLYYWETALYMSIDHPLGSGVKGFNLLSPLYFDENIETGKNPMRSVHSTWFEALTEVGFIGLIVFLLMIHSSLNAFQTCKKALLAENKIDDYFKIVALQASLICFLISMTFLNRMRAEILYWLILFSACAYNIYIIKPRKQMLDSKQFPEKKHKEM